MTDRRREDLARQDGRSLQKLRALRHIADVFEPREKRASVPGWFSLRLEWLRSRASNSGVLFSGGLVGRTLKHGVIVALRFPQKFREIARRASYRLLITIYELAYRRRRQVKSGSAGISDAVHAFQMSRLAGRLLGLTHRLSDRRIPLLPRTCFIILRHGFAFIATAHMAAGQNARALTTVRLMNILFRTAVRTRRRPTSHVYFEVLRRTSLFSRIVHEVPEFEEVDDFYLNRIFGIGHLYRLNPVTARAFFERATAMHESYFDFLMLGRSYLLEDDYRKAAEMFSKSAEIFPPSVMAHQNYAGRYDVASYKPKAWELADAGRLMIYDNLGQFAEEQFLHGNLMTSLRIYHQLLRYQDEIAVGAKLPRKIPYVLKAEFDHFSLEKSVRILPYEWVTQFGHIGLLSAFLRMAKLGMIPDANYVVLAPAEKTVNEEYLSYWEKHFCVVRDPDLVDELFPYQRFFGENFMVGRSAGLLAEPWTRAAARAQIICAAAESDEALIVLSDEDHALGREMLRTLNVPENTWYVGLHAREGGFYSEVEGGMSEHRNSRIEDYFPAIESIVASGGVVIRLGDPSMRPLPPMPGVIDYAHSKAKSPRMDLFLLATSRFVVGTTSGLTTAAHSFGTPTILVNCISNDWQLWDGETDFIVKKVYDRQEHRYLTLAETYRHPVQGYLMNNTVLESHGYFTEPNSAEEIQAAVRYKLDVVSGRRSRIDENDDLMRRYRHAMSSNSCMFGAARPVPDFLAENLGLLGTPDPGFEAFPLAQWPDGISDIGHDVRVLPVTRKAPTSGW